MFEIRQGREEDKSQILELIKDVFNEEQAQRADRHWHWQCQDPRLEKPGYFGVVAVWNDRVIGSLSGIPMGLYVDGQPFPANWHTDNCVHWGNLRRAWREIKRSGNPQDLDFSNGISAAMIDFAAPGFGQAGKHNTDAAEVLLHKMGFTALKDSGSWTRIISFRQPLEEYAGKIAALLLGSLADVFLPSIPKPSLDVQVLEGEFDNRFDILWEEAKNAYPAITRRDRASLNWRYRQHPDLAYTVLTVSEQDRLLGYLVYSTFFRHRQRRGQIVDILAGKEDSATRRALIAAALRRMRTEAVHKVECYTTSPVLTGDLKRLKFKARLHNGKAALTLARYLPDKEYYITRGDGDGG